MRCDEGTEVGGRVADARLQVMCGLVLLAITAGAAAGPCVASGACWLCRPAREKTHLQDGRESLTCRMGGKSSPAERAKKKKGAPAEWAEKEKALMRKGLKRKRLSCRMG